MSGRHWIASLIFGWVGFCLCLAGCQGMVATWPNGNPMFVPSSGTTVRATSRQVNYPPGNTQTAYQGYSSGVIPTGYQGQSSMSAGMPVSPGMPVGPISSPYPPAGMPMGPSGLLNGVTQGPVGMPPAQPGPMMMPGQPGPGMVAGSCGPGGCGGDGNGGPGDGKPPTELREISHMPYIIEPPDILVLDAVRMIPKPPYIVQPLDVLLLRVAEPAPNQPIEGTYTVTPEGTINLGYSYGLVRVAGLTLAQVEETVRRQLGRVLKEPQVAVGLAQFRGIQQVRGEHLVRPDGTISLGTYGCVYVTGLTLEQARVAICRQLSCFLLDPDVSVDVYSYNSKVYYVITDGAGYGQQVYRFPITGKETVLDAVSNIGGLPAVGSLKKIWVARPTPENHECNEVLPVDWLALAEGGSTGTNWQLFPGDRVFIQSNPLIKFDNRLAQFLSPIERILGVTLLAANVRNAFRSNNGNNGFVTSAFVVR
jgi:polysaccharide export outer membrane protein